MVFDVLKAIARRKANHLSELIHGKPERIDKDFPMNIRLKCTLQIEQTPFVLAGDSLVCKYPGLDQTVEAVGRFTLMDKFEFFNFYLRAREEESVLQIVRDAKTKKVLEAVLYREIYNIFPAPNGEFGDWPDWIDPDEGMIGDFRFNTPAGNSYEIVFPDCPGDRTLPFSCVEKITDDPLLSDEIVTQEHYFAIYGRNVESEMVERLLIGKVEDDEKASIQIMAGLPIDVGAGEFGSSGFLKIL
jgi:hypothetical protein